MSVFTGIHFCAIPQAQPAHSATILQVQLNKHVDKDSTHSSSGSITHSVGAQLSQACMQHMHTRRSSVYAGTARGLCRLTEPNTCGAHLVFIFYHVTDAGKPLPSPDTLTDEACMILQDLTPAKPCNSVSIRSCLYSRLQEHANIGIVFNFPVLKSSSSHSESQQTSEQMQ